MGKFKNSKKRKEKLTLLQAEIGWWTIGCPAKGNKGFGVLNESGRNLVPATTKKSNKKPKFIKKKKKGKLIWKNRVNTFGGTTHHDNGDYLLLRALHNVLFSVAEHKYRSSNGNGGFGVKRVCLFLTSGLNF